MSEMIPESDETNDERPEAYDEPLEFADPDEFSEGVDA